MSTGPPPAAPAQVIVATFPTAERAEGVVPALEDLGRHLHGLALGNIAVLEKLPDGRATVQETHDVRAGLSHVAANITGAAAWLVYGLFGFSGPVAGELAFETTEEAIQHMVRDGGFADAELAGLAETLDAGSSALVLVVPAAATGPVVDILARFGGTVVQRPFTPEIAAELEPAPGPSADEDARGG